MTTEMIVRGLGLVVVGAPCALLALLGGASILGRPLNERKIGAAGQIATVTGLLSALTILGWMLVGGTHHLAINLGSWVHIPNYHFAIKFEFDRLSVPFVILSYVLCGTIGAFATRYMHRERGFNRFFVLFALFMLGMVVTSLSGTIETLFAGWEFVGLSSALLVAFYQERVGPVSNGLRVWTVYRISDAALLLAAVVMHHLTGQGDFDKLLGPGNWPEGHAALTEYQALVVGSLLLLAAAGKSALVPFSGWLPRAMEGPTPSSAVFYGALSVHLGAFLLLRVSPILDLSAPLCIAIILLGLTTAVFAAFTSRVQTDIKCALSFASLTQVGIIVAEIGFASEALVGPTIAVALRYVALVHILGHGCLRTLQFLRAPTLLHDYRLMENAIGDRLPRGRSFWDRVFTPKAQVWLYRLALERGYLDAALADYVVKPFIWVFRKCDGLERRWTNLLAGGQSRESDEMAAAPGALDELL